MEMVRAPRNRDFAEEDDVLDRCIARMKPRSPATTTVAAPQVVHGSAAKVAA